MLDLAYVEDSKADVDMNIVKTGSGPLHRAAGHGRGAAVRSRGAQPPARPRRYRHPAADCAPARLRRPDPRQVELRLCLVATTNPDKLREIRAILGRPAGGAAEPWRTSRRCPNPKRQERRSRRTPGSRRCTTTGASTGIDGERPLTVAEDSGLVIDALDGEPGVHSARFLRPDASYPERFAEILPAPGRASLPRTRRARFVCARGGRAERRDCLRDDRNRRGRDRGQPAGARRVWVRPDLLLPALRAHAGRSHRRGEAARRAPRRSVSSAGECGCERGI